MKFENKHIQNLMPYMVASHKIWDVTPEERIEILKLDWNEATIAPSPKVLERIQSLLAESSFFQYYPSTYNEILHEKLSNYVSLPKENIQYFPSSDSLHEYISTVFLAENDEVLILGPTYDNFRLAAESHGCKVQYFNYDQSFQFNLELFASQIQEVQPKIVYICNPNNPTGTVIEPLKIKYLLDKFPNVLFLIDEAYIEFSGNSVSDCCLTNDNLLISRTFSKAFALANFRIGYLLSSKSNIDSISKIRNAKNFNTFSQEAAIAALDDLEYTQNYVNEVNQAKRIFLDFLTSECNGISAQMGFGNFILMRFDNVELKTSFFNFMKNNNIFLRDLTHSELLSNCLRITIGNKSQMEVVMGKIKQFFE